MYNIQPCYTKLYGLVGRSIMVGVLRSSANDNDNKFLQMIIKSNIIYYKHSGAQERNSVAILITPNTIAACELFSVVCASSTHASLDTTYNFSTKCSVSVCVHSVSIIFLPSFEWSIYAQIDLSSILIMFLPN